MKPKEIEIPEENILKHVIFLVDSGYMKTSSEPFYTEIKELFGAKGYTAEDTGHNTVYLVKDRTKIYVHPNQLSGPVMKEHVYEIVNTLRLSRTFTYLKTDIGGNVYSFTLEEELSFYRQKYGHMIHERLREIFNTESKKRFIERERKDDLARHISIETTNSYIEYKKPAYLFINEGYNELVENGHLIETTKKIGVADIPHCRTATHQELNFTKTPLFAYTEKGDLIWCIECEQFQLLPHGADKCPRCEEVGKMKWYDDNKPEYEISEIDTDYFQIIRKQPLEALSRFLSPESLTNII